MMQQEIQLRLSPEEAKDEACILQKLSNQSGISRSKIHYKWKKRSIDARKKEIKILGTFLVSNEVFSADINSVFVQKNVSNSKSAAIIGFGPAGIYAALRLIERGYKPIVFERGKDVRSRRRDLAKLNKEMILNPESNYCFGEGGAGTYSDGKLYTRSKKRGDVEKVLKGFVQFGAKEDILIDAHPHIGTNKLPQIIVAMREAILACGGEIHFDSKLTDFIIEENRISGIVINHHLKYSFGSVILATGHSARDIFYLLNDKKIALQAKPFALGVRIEHSQQLIDKIQYHGRLNDDFLPPASYSLVTQVDGKGVFSFCMCPGGIVAPCATNEGEVVTNGWSPSKRNNPYSNSGIVVSVSQEDLKLNEITPLVCLDFQKQIEHKAWELAGKTQKVPAQRMVDFMQGKKSIDLPNSSYQPGLVSVDLNSLFPTFVSKRLKQGLLDFGKKMPGFLTNNAVLHAPESRTSSPVCIPRNPETMQHVQISGLFPCAEGAGYAGGIVSAAVDGMNCADKLADLLDNQI
jgi:uncharacterized FAD-dependent dehydrogenase